MGIPDFANQPIARPPSTSQIDDMITVIPSPATAYEHRRDGKFGVALLVITGTMMLISFLMKNAMSPIMDAEFTRGMKAQLAKNPQLPVAAMEKMRGFTENWGWVYSLGTPIIICVLGLTLWLTGKLVGSRQTAGQGVAVATFAFVPRIIQAIATWIQVLVMSPDSLNGIQRVSIGPARLVDPDTASPLLVAMLSRLDLFVIWSTVLLAIGLSVTGQITRKQGAVGAAIVWLLATAFALWTALRSMP